MRGLIRYEINGKSPRLPVDPFMKTAAHSAAAIIVYFDSFDCMIQFHHILLSVFSVLSENTGYARRIGKKIENTDERYEKGKGEKRKIFKIYIHSLSPIDSVAKQRNTNDLMPFCRFQRHRWLGDRRKDRRTKP
jgi:hypothetical protein